MPDPSHKIKAVFTDMDGTLLNPNHRISDYTAETLKRLKARGIHFIVCTGRPYPDVFATIRKCGLEPEYIITSNGARIHDGNFKLLSEQNMDAEIVAQLVRLHRTPGADGDMESAEAKASKKHYLTNVYRNEEWLTDEMNPKVRLAFDESFKTVVLGDQLGHLQASELQGVHEMWFYGETKNLVGLEMFLNKKYPDTLRCSFSTPNIIDCVPKHVTKGNAVVEVCSMLGITVDEVASFGDGMNDEPMLQVAGFPYVMANAQPALKESVPRAEVIGTNVDDGVATKLKQLFF